MKQTESRAWDLEKEKRERDALSKALMLPQDAVKGETLLTFTGQRVVYIENYRSILLYSDTKIQIQAKHYRLTVAGRNLSICYYDKDEMKITGHVEAISFE
ncbi:MAG: sporulation protein [Lachnospiraceae bacterium]|nr:sporulation protein [Lachnospiraceae bacterium]